MRPDPHLEVDPFALLKAGLDHIEQGISVFDSRLHLVGWNRRFVELLEFPDGFVRYGIPFEKLISFNAERGEYGPGQVDDLVIERVRQAQTFAPHYFERTRPGGLVLAVQGEPLPQGGFVTVYTDVTDRKRAEKLAREHTEELEHRVDQRTTELRKAHDELVVAAAKQVCYRD